MTTQENAIDFNSPAYKRSRAAYTWECAFEYFVSLLVSGAFLSKLLLSIGMSDALIGIISSFISLSYLFQLFSIFVVQRITNTKRFAVLFHSLGQVLFMFIYLVPFLPFEYKHKELLVIISILLAYFGNYFVNSIIYRWGNSHVLPTRRGRFSATKEMISLATGTVVTLVAGYVMDAFELAGNLESGFLFCSFAIFIFALCDFICLMLIKNKIKTPEEKREKAPLREVIKNTLGNKNFLNITALQILWDVGRFVTVGFISTYSLNVTELAFTVGSVQIISLLGHGTRFVISRPFGRYSDKHSYAKGIELGLVLAAIAFGSAMFMTPTTRFLYIVYMIFQSSCHAGVGANLLNVTYSYVNEKYVSEAMAIKNSISGICGFFASLVASALLTDVQANGNVFLGMSLYGQQVLAAISFLVMIIAILFTKFVIEKQKIMVQ